MGSTLKNTDFFFFFKSTEKHYHSGFKLREILEDDTGELYLFKTLVGNKINKHSIKLLAVLSDHFHSANFQTYFIINIYISYHVKNFELSLL